MTEDKQAICDALLATLKRTRSGSRIVALRYKGTPTRSGWFSETVTVSYLSGHDHIINVSGDSGEALIRDVVGNI